MLHINRSERGSAKWTATNSERHYEIPRDFVGVIYNPTYFVFFCLCLSFLMLNISSAFAQKNGKILKPGDLVITGFSGITLLDKDLPPGADPNDNFFIDTEGASAQIKSLQSISVNPDGKLVEAPSKFAVKAKDVGQVFAITLDDGLGAKTPNIYLGATSYYGLQIIHPDRDGDGKADPSKKGETETQWMEGQFGPGGDAGSIWQVNGETGEVKLFATIPNNSGPGLGDIVFDKVSKQFFVSDLDTGLIYRLDQDGNVIDSFDHGVTGRPIKGFSQVPDDGKIVDLSNPEFDTLNVETWGYTQAERRVNGMAIHNGRLYYAVLDKTQVWSVGIGDDGSFSDDIRWEFDASELPGKGPITDMLFDKAGRIYLAQRGVSQGSYDYSQFAKPEESSVTRYRLESPDNPDTESRWVKEKEEYAIGIVPKHYQANGGIALGYAHDKNGKPNFNSCDAMLWSTGSRLQSSQATGDEAAKTAMDVHGIQGNTVAMVRPNNVPPQKSYFIDYDSLYNDEGKAGHLGDVEIWQPCEGVAVTGDDGDPLYGFDEPLDGPPEDFPEDWPDPKLPYSANLELAKWADPQKCILWAGKWNCRYRIRVRNTGPDVYNGPVLIADWLPNPGGSQMFFSAPAGWNCWGVGGANYRCGRLNTVLLPGQSVVITAIARVPVSYPKCHIKNIAEILMAPGGTQWNTKLFDDIDEATAIIPAANCPSGKKANLRLKKDANPGSCLQSGADFYCRYRINIKNTGPGVYNGKIEVRDTPASGTVFAGSAPGIWNCNPSWGSYKCKHPNTILFPSQEKNLWVWLKTSIPVAKSHNCKIKNSAKITSAASPSNLNTNPGDDSDSAIAQVPAHICQGPLTKNLKLEKKALSDPCLRVGTNFYCKYRVRVRNTGPGTYIGNVVVRDSYLPGTTGIFSSSPSWTCNKLVTPAHDCKRFSVIGAGEYKDLIAWVKVPLHYAKSYNCKIKNRAKILTAAGGTNNNTNAGDDKDEAVAKIPVEYCQKTNLKLRKKADPQICQAVGSNFRCEYRVTVQNTGPGTYLGSLKVEDKALTPGAQTLKAGLACPGGTCNFSLASTKLKSGQRRSFSVFVKVSKDVAKASNCKIRNFAKITYPLGGTRNTLAGDDKDTAVASVPNHICPVLTSPSHSCPPGYVYSPSAGKCLRKDGQCPPNKYWNMATQSCNDRDLGEPTGSVPEVDPGDGIIVLPPLRCRFGERQVSANWDRRGWRVRRVRRGRNIIYCARRVNVGPPLECRAGEYEVSPGWQRKGWRVRTVRRNRQVIYCARRVALPPLQCAIGERLVKAGWKRRGWQVRTVRRGRQVIYCARRVSLPPLQCSNDERRVKAGWQSKGWSVRTVRRGREVIYCARRVVVTPPPKVCTGGRLNVRGKCVCPQGTRWNGQHLLPSGGLHRWPFECSR